MGRQLLNNKRVSLMKKDLRLQIKIVHHCLARRHRENVHTLKKSSSLTKSSSSPVKMKMLAYPIFIETT